MKLNILVISYERLVSINNLPNQTLEHIMKYLSNQQIKQSCLTLNKQWNKCASKGLSKFSIVFVLNFLLKFSS